MERITVNLGDEVGKKLKAKADSEKRSTSNYVEMLIEGDLRAAGMLGAADDTADEAALIAATADVGGIRNAVAVLKRAARRRKTPVPA